MDFRSFTKEQLLNVAYFEMWWLLQHEADPVSYPLFLDPGDWDERFSYFVDHKAELI